MTTLRQAAELALEAMKDFDYDKRMAAIEAVEKALAENKLQQEPVGQLIEAVYGRGQVMWFKKPLDGAFLYTSPPANKPWVGLTDDEIRTAYCAISVKEWAIGGMEDAEPFARAIEAKLKVKNT